MTFSRLSLMVAAGLLATLASCAPPPAPVSPAPAPVKPAPPPSAVPSTNWRDWSVSAGTWNYRVLAGGSVANFGSAGGDALLSIRCDLASRRIMVARKVTAFGPGQMTVRTSFGAASWPVQASAEAAPSPVYAIAARAASDGVLDQMSFSRGRFAIEVPGAPPLVVPAWAEVGRVVEDCRG